MSVTTIISKEKKLHEIIKCNKSAIYYLNTYGKIYHPKRGYIKLELYQFQEKLIEGFIQKRFNISLKSRQMGLSTITAGFVAWLLQFHQAKEVVIVANKKQVAQNFIRKVKTFINATPPWLRCTIIVNNKSSIELANGSRLGAYATTSDAARSESLSLLIIDEAAIIDTKKVEDLWGAVFPTLFVGGNAIIISTPKGVGNFYHRQWEAAASNQSEFNAVKCHWTEHPEYSKDLSYDEAGNPTSTWYREQCREFQYDKRKIAQELDCGFLGSGDNIIDAEVMANIAKDLRTPIRTAGIDHNIFYFEEPIKEASYLIAADVARGDGSDYSACHVIKISSEANEQVAEYKGKLPIDLFAELLMKLGEEYNSALIACEANSFGLGTCLIIEKANYPNIFYSSPATFKTTSKEKIRKEMDEKKIPGFQTTSATRPIMCSALEELLRTREFIIRSVRSYNELKTFIWEKGRPTAIRGCNDDLTFGGAIACLLLKTYLKEYRNAKAMRKKMLDATTVQRTDIGESIPILHSANRSALNNPWKILGKNGEIEDLTWLLDK